MVRRSVRTRASRGHEGEGDDDARCDVVVVCCVRRHADATRVMRRDEGKMMMMTTMSSLCPLERAVAGDIAATTPRASTMARHTC